jgi:hypothetical protein
MWLECEYGVHLLFHIIANINSVHNSGAYRVLPLFKGSLYLGYKLKSQQPHLLWNNINLLHNKYYKFTYVSVLQDIVLGTHDLAASLDLFSSAGQQYEARNLDCGSNHGVLGTWCCAALPFQYSNLQYHYYVFQTHEK